jgi:hypothetical protein
MIKQLSFWGDNTLSKPVVILISGKAGTGKDTYANALTLKLRDKGYNAIQDRFAFSVKQCAIDYFGWDGQKDEKGRKLLQDIGKIGRKYDPVLWPKTLIHRIDSHFDLAQIDILVIADWRFPNEKNFFEMTDLFQIITVRIEAPNREIIDKESLAYIDVSEVALDDYEFDYNINNEYEGMDFVNTSCDKFIENYFKKE